jgi:hypothetical protein
MRERPDDVLFIGLGWKCPAYGKNDELTHARHSDRIWDLVLNPLRFEQTDFG